MEKITENILISLPEYTSARDYWLGKLAGVVSGTGIQYDYMERRKYTGSEYKSILNDEIANKLAQIGKNSELLIYVIMLGAFKALLHKLSGAEDILIGSPVLAKEGQDSGGNSAMLLRDRINTEMTYRQLLEGIRETISEAHKNQHYPMGKIMEQLGEETIQKALFRTVFAFENIHKKEHIEKIISEYESDIVISFLKSGPDFNETIIYNSVLYSEQTIKRLSELYGFVLGQVLSNFSIPMGGIDIVMPEEVKLLVHDFNNTYSPYDSEQLIHRMFEERVLLNQDNTALVYHGSTVSYEELNKRSNQLARMLREKGVTRNEIVGLMTERSFEMIIGLLAILKAGGAYLPIDPEYPKERIKYMLEDSRTKILLKYGPDIDKSWFDGEIIDLKHNLHFNSECGNIEIVNEPHDLAYVIYTSGSTGNPKGVMIEHKAVHNYINAIGDKIDFSAGRVILALTTVSFDIFVTETLASLAKGLKIVIADENQQSDMNLLSDIIINNHVEMLQTTPSRMALLMAGNGNKECFDMLKTIMVGGEAFPQKLLEELKKLTAAKIYNMYGPTETTVWSALKEVTECSRITIGKPIANTRIYIMGTSGKLQPLGVAGELCIAGDGVARGYLNRTELTGEKFIPELYCEDFDGFNPEKNKTMYKTGDLARWLPDGDIEFLGRMDYQVKVRGYRIEPGEIEYVLQQYESVKDVVAKAFDDDDGNKYLCAYLVCGGEIDLADIREYSLKKLPDYMVPSYFVKLEELPMTPNGKVDRKALPEPLSVMGSRSGYIAPASETEKRLAAMWCELLGLEKVGATENFFVLGGHSLKAVNMINRIFKEFDLVLLLSDIFKYPTVRSLASYMESKQKENFISLQAVKELVFYPEEKQYDDFMSILPVEEKEHYPVSPVQNRIFSYEQVPDLKTANNIAGVTIIHSELDIGRLGQAFGKLLERHEPLRTSFTLKNGILYQYVHKNVEFHVGYIDQSEEADPSGSGTKSLNKIIGEFIQAFDLNKAPLLRACVVKLADGGFALIYDMHRIISDAVSIGILRNELLELYNGEELTPLKFQYKNYACRYMELKGKDALKIQEEYWFSRLAGELPVLNMHCEYKRPLIKSFEGSRVGFEANQELAGRIFEFAKASGTSVYNVLLAAYNTILFKYTGQEDFIVGTAVSGRAHPDLDNTFGLFANYLPLRNTPDGNMTFHEFLEAVKQNTADTHENQLFSFEEHAGRLNYKQEPGRNFLFDTTFTMQNILTYHSTVHRNLHDNLHEASIPVISHYFVNKRLALFDLSFHAFHGENNLWFELEYCSKLFSKEYIESFSKHFTNILERIVEEPDASLLELDMMTTEEKREILLRFNEPLQKKAFEEFCKYAELDISDDSLKDTAQNCMIYILDKNENLVPVGLPGELCIVAPESEIRSIAGNKFNSGNFKPSPFDPDDLMLKTKKLAKWFTDGSYKLLEEAGSDTDFIEASQKNTQGENLYSTIKPVEEMEYYPVSSAQRRLFILNQFEGASTNYNITEVRPQGPLNRERLEYTIRELLKRHEAFRTSFEMVDGEPVQKIHKSVELEINYIDTSEEKLNETIREFVKPFDLSKPPLLRVAAMKINESRHVLVFDIHHIISDGVSMSILDYEYFMIRSGHELPPLKLQYKDFAVWQNGLGNSSIYKNKEEYWLNRFYGDIPVLSLPTDYPRPAIQSYEGDNVKFVIEKELLDSIRRTAVESGSTIYMVMLAAFNVLLSKITGQEDIIIGSPVAGRNHADLEKIIGIFLNTVALRNYPSKDKSFTEFLDEVKRNSLDAFENQEYQFEMLLDKIRLPRDLSRTPLFSVMFNMLNMYSTQSRTPWGTSNSNGLDSPYESNTSKFDINMYLQEIDNTLRINCQYCSRLFKKATVEYIMREYRKLLDGITSDPKKKLGEYKILDGRQLEKGFNKVQPRNKYLKFAKSEINNTIINRFEQQVRKYGDRPAIKTINSEINYNNLNERVNQAAHAIIGCSLEKDQNIAILFEHNIDMVAGMLAVLKAGHAYVPLDPEYPEERLLYFIQDSLTDVIITNNNNLDMAKGLAALAGKQIKIININRTESTLSKENPVIKTTPSQRAYILYTSGSTGKPKGVIQNHRNVLHFIRNYTNKLHISAEDKLTLFSSYSFDAAVMDIYGALLNGAVLYPYSIKNDGGITNLVNWLKIEDITIYHSIPTVYRYFIDNLKNGMEFPRLRLVVMGGEAVMKKDVEAYGKHFSDDCIFVNGLGPSESTVTLQYFIGKNTEITGNAVPVGYPVDDTEVCILDENGEEAPVFGAGEIVYKSKYLALGYWNQPEKTKEVFKKDPITGKGRVYYSGDSGCMLLNGGIQFMGRNDFQVKIRGYRVELQEIEAALDSIEEIQKSVVKAVKTGSGENCLAAYYVTNSSAELDVSTITAALKKRLPDYMHPACYVQLDKLPLTPGGKLDRNGLPDPDGRKDTGEEYEAPSDELEQKLAAIWQDVLGIDRIGINHNFFNNGGNSIMAIKMEACMEKYNIPFMIADVFKYQTVKELAMYIRGEDKCKSAGELNDIKDDNALSTRVIKVDNVENEGDSYCIKNIEPFNELFFKGCFYNSIFPIINFFNRSINPLLINDVIAYDFDSTNADTVLLNASYISQKTMNALLDEAKIGAITKAYSDDIINDIITAIKQDRPVVIWVDCFYEPIRNDVCNKTHLGHTWLIYGYNEPQKTFHIFEHKFRDNLSYQKKTISYIDLINSYNGFADNFNQERHNPSYYEFYSNQVASPDEIHTFNDIERHRNEFARNMAENKELIWNGLEKLKTFIGYYESYVSSEESLKERADILVESMNNLINAKRVEAYRIIKLFDGRDDLAGMAAEIIDNWDYIRARIGKFIYAPLYEKEVFDMTIKKMEQILEIENQFNEKLFSLLNPLVGCENDLMKMEVIDESKNDSIKTESAHENEIDRRMEEIVHPFVSELMPEVEVDFDTDISEIGIVSVLFVRFVVLLEREFGIRFEDDYLNYKKFSTLRDISDYVQKRIESKKIN
jgi:amino acid adenylation domain-containing protein